MSISRTLITSLVLVSLSVALARNVHAGQLDPEPGLDEARTLYRQGLFDDAITTLNDVIDALETLRDLEEKRIELADAHFLLGLSYLAVRDEVSAKENFARAAALDPERVLDPEVYAPKVVSLYGEARNDVRGPVVLPLPETKVPLQEPPEEEPLFAAGTRVRATLAGDNDGIVGSFISADADVLTLTTEHRGTLELPRNMLTKLEISTGRKGHALWGLLIGAGAGALIGLAEGADENCVGDGCYTRGENIGYGALGAGIVGGLVGALIKTDRWMDAPTGKLSIRTSPDFGAGVFVSWSF